MPFCWVCKKEKSKDKFYSCHNPKKRGQCKSCLSKKNKKRWRETYTDPNKRGAANRRLKLRYGITLEDYDRLALLQNYVCAICGKPNTKGFRLVIDHNHKTGIVRGLLCQRCNKTLGQIEESPNLMRRMIAYIELHTKEIIWD